MKAQMKAVMASAVVIVLALAAVSGVTYSWFSDSDEADVTINTATIDIDVGFDIGGTWKDSYTIPENWNGGELKVDFSIKNGSTTSITYRTVTTVTATYDPNTTFSGDLTKIKVFGQYLEQDPNSNNGTWVSMPVTNGWRDVVYNESEVNDDIHETLTVDYAGTGNLNGVSLKITLKVEAYPIEYEHEQEVIITDNNGIKTATTQINGSNATSNGVNVDIPELNTTINFNKAAVNGMEGVVVTVTDQTAQYAVNNGDVNGEVLGAIGVTFTDKDGYPTNMSTGGKATVTMTIDGIIEGPTVFHIVNGDYIPVNSGYSHVGNTTIITFIAESFSDYVAISVSESVWDGSEWDGGVEGSGLEVIPGKGTKTGTIVVHSAKGLVYLNTLSDKWVKYYTNGKGTSFSDYSTNNGGLGTDYYYSWTWRILLANDLDMNSQSMDSIDITRWGTFDGCGHTISNVELKEGQGSLFLNGAKLIMNLDIENIIINSPNNQRVGAVANQASCENVHVMGAEITGGKYVGGLVGYGSSFIDCSVTDSNIKGKEKTVGGLVGYACGDPNMATISGNVVDNVEVIGAYNVGGLLGQAQHVTVENNTVRYVTLESTDSLPEDASSNEVRTGDIVARIVSTDEKPTIIDSNNVAENISLVVSSTEELQKAINNNATHIILTDGEFIADLYNVSERDKLTITGQGADTRLSFSNLQVRASQFNELTIENCTVERMPNKTWGHLVFGASINSEGVYTISNCFFNGNGSQGIYINEDYVSGAIFNIENCTFNGDFGKEGAITIQNNSNICMTVNVTGCVFNNLSESSHKIFIHYEYDGWNLNADGVQVHWNAQQ